MKTSSVLELDNYEAKNFFLKSDSYYSGRLPEYYNFKRLLQNIDSKISDCTNLAELCKTHNSEIDFPDNYKNINYTIYTSKDSKYSWRALKLLHPVLYVFLVNTITEESCWKELTRSIKFHSTNQHISCESFPIASKTKRSQDEIMITNWHHKVERETLKLALEYQYLAEADISNCYDNLEFEYISQLLNSGSIDSQYAETMGKKIESILRQLVGGKMNGLPQSGELMHFIAEIILLYIDNKLESSIPSTVKDYHIIRYRDDYRIFTQSENDAKTILLTLNNLLRDMGLRLNPKKIRITTNIIKRSLKEDKYCLITNRVEMMYPNEHHEIYHQSLIKELLEIREYGKKYPQSGSVERALAELYEKRVFPMKEAPDGINQIISLIIDIMLDSPRTYGLGIAIIGKITEKWQKSEKLILLEKIKRKFILVPNIDYLNIWLQRLTITLNRNVIYETPLCQKIYAGEHLKIWNSDWLKDGILPTESIIDEDKIATLSQNIPVKQVRLFSFDNR